jgi:hypothetical protein
MPGIANARRPCLRPLAYILGPAVLLASIAAGGAARAAAGTARPALPAPGATRCSLQPARTSVKPARHDPSGGTILVKPSSSGCRDLNLYSVGATDNYIGWVQVGGKWKSCGKWVHLTARHLKLAPLCTGIPAGTLMQVVAQDHVLVPVIVVV